MKSVKTISIHEIQSLFVVSLSMECKCERTSLQQNMTWCAPHSLSYRTPKTICHEEPCNGVMCASMPDQIFDHFPQLHQTSKCAFLLWQAFKASIQRSPRGGEESDFDRRTLPCLLMMEGPLKQGNITTVYDVHREGSNHLWKYCIINVAKNGFLTILRFVEGVHLRSRVHSW